MESKNKRLLFRLLHLFLALYMLTWLPSSEAKVDCSKQNASCYQCVDHSSCYWCAAKKTCSYYPASKIIPRDCDKAQWFYKQCTVSGFWLVIILPCLALLLVLVIGCCIYCCCCRTSKAKKEEKYRLRDAQTKREREQRHAMYAAKKADRQEKIDEIRRKYGLKTGSGGYQQLDNVP